MVIICDYIDNFTVKMYHIIAIYRKWGIEK